METSAELNFLSALLPFAGIVFIIAVGVVLLNQQFQKTIYRQQLAQEELKNQHQLELLRSSIQVQEDERKRIAQDLHDELGAILAISRMHLVQLEQHPDMVSMQQHLPALQQIRGLTENALASMRRISHELMPPQLQTFGLIKTLESVANRFNEMPFLEVTILSDTTLPNLSWPVQLGLYRISMEFMNNTIKYAKATKITIYVKMEMQTLVYRYHDNGIGLPEQPNQEGLGHKSIQGRVNALGGVLEMGNQEESGFFATIKMLV